MRFNVTANILEQLINFAFKQHDTLKIGSCTVLNKLWNKLNALSSKKPLKYALYLSAVIIFFAIILIPPILGILIKTPTIQNVINQPALMNTALTSIRNSFIIGLTVAALDLLAGIPLAWLITRSKSRWISILDTLADIPFVVPTCRLGLLAFAVLELKRRPDINTFRRISYFSRLASCIDSAIHFFASRGSSSNGRRPIGLQDGV